MTEQMLSVPTPDGDMGAYVRRPDGAGPFPVVVYFHHGPGLDEGSKESMQLLADAGYYVVSPDRYHRDGSWLAFDPKVMRSGTPEGDQLREKMMGVLMGTTDDMVETRPDGAARGAREGARRTEGADGRDRLLHRRALGAAHDRQPSGHVHRGRRAASVVLHDSRRRLSASRGRPLRRPAVRGLRLGGQDAVGATRTSRSSTRRTT